MPEREDYADLVAELRGQTHGAVFDPVALMARAADAIEHLSAEHQPA